MMLKVHEQGDAPHSHKKDLIKGIHMVMGVTPQNNKRWKELRNGLWSTKEGTGK